MRRRVLASLAKTGGWVNPYVTDGLVAMWDGEWNAGGGVHESTPTIIKNLAGEDGDLSYDSTVGFGSDFFQGPGLSTSAVGILTSSLDFGKMLQGFPHATYELAMSDNSQKTCYVWTTFLIMFSGIRNAENALRMAVSYGFNGYGSFDFAPTFMSVTAGTISIAINDGATSYKFKNGVQVGSGKSTRITEPDSSIKFGVLDKTYCIRVYDRVLSASEVAANCAVDKARFNLP